MFAFPRLGDLFARIAAALPATVRTDARVASIVRDGSGVTVTDASGHAGRFDQLVLACGAEESRRMLCQDADL